MLHRPTVRPALCFVRAGCEQENAEIRATLQESEGDWCHISVLTPAQFDEARQTILFDHVFNLDGQNAEVLLTRRREVPLHS